MKRLVTTWRILQWVLVGLVLDWGFWFFVDTVRHVPGPGSLPFEFWYGDWRHMLTMSGLFTLFLITFLLPRRRLEWRNAGLYAAFLISLFTEMFGVPLTIYFLAPVLGVSPWAFGFYESHLWALLLERLGVLPLHLGVYLVMAVSSALIATGAGLVGLGWVTVHRGRGALVADGIYGYVRHPQYLGLILVIVGFIIQWPTLPTLLMAPVLIAMYVRLARREDDRLAVAFGEAFQDYAARTPAFVPWGRGNVRRAGSTGEVGLTFCFVSPGLRRHGARREDQPAQRFDRGDERDAPAPGEGRRSWRLLAGGAAVSPALAAVAAAAVALALSLATAVEATHKVDHRYVVLGYVRDATGPPVARTIVRVVREKTGLAYEDRTGGDGFYLVIVHLHDEDVLEPLRVTAGRATLRVEARFDPLDPRTPRGTSVDVIDGVARERPEEFAAALERYMRK